jgi:heme exporter protein D
MGRDAITFWLAIAGTLCWFVCFLWMHQISAKQNRMLAELREQAQRIEDLSRSEHELIKEVHPQVGEIMAGVDAVKDAVQSTSEAVSQIAEHGAR